MASPGLILHVGHPKTGSSTLQSSFALSRPALARAGLHYPEPGDPARARAGRMTSGNVAPGLLVRRFRNVRQRADGARAILLSNEDLFGALRRDDSPLAHLAEDGTQITILLFLRDPFDWAVSVYSQAVKSQGLTEAFPAFLRRFPGLTRLEKFLRVVDRHRLPCRMHNISRGGTPLLDAACGVLELPAGTLTAPPVSHVNRSLTRAETGLVRRINADAGAAMGKAVADALIEGLPDLKAEPPHLAEPDYAAFAARSRPVMARLAPRLARGHAHALARYDEIYPDGAVDRAPPLSEAQQAIAARVLNGAAP